MTRDEAAALQLLLASGLERGVQLLLALEVLLRCEALRASQLGLQLFSVAAQVAMVYLALPSVRSAAWQHSETRTAIAALINTCAKVLRACLHLPTASPSMLSMRQVMMKVRWRGERWRGAASPWHQPGGGH